MAPCDYCSIAKAVIRRPKTGDMTCKECFFARFEDEVHRAIVDHNLFKRGEKVCIAASGGKDSTVLAHCLTTLNQRHDYGLNLFLLSIDEGITGYRDDSLEVQYLLASLIALSSEHSTHPFHFRFQTVKQNQMDYGIPLKILSYQELYGWTMDKIVSQIGLKNNCASLHLPAHHRHENLGGPTPSGIACRIARNVAGSLPLESHIESFTLSSKQVHFAAYFGAKRWIVARASWAPTRLQPATMLTTLQSQCS
jgi:hypothetical protein